MLTEVSLKLSRCNISDKGLEILSFTLKKRKLLKSLALSLKDNNNISSEGLKSLSFALIELKSLSKLDLDIFNYENKDSGLENLFSDFEKLKMLSQLALRFWQRSQIGDKTFSNLSSALKELNSLSKLTLEFFSCKQIRDRDLES